MRRRKTFFSDNDLESHEPKDVVSICVTCLNDVFLKTAFSNRPSTKCAACGKSEHPSVDAGFLAKISRNVIADHFEIYADIYPGYHGLNLSAVVKKVIGCDNLAFCDTVASYLTIPQESTASDEEFFGEGQEYSERTFEFDSAEDEREYLVSEWDRIAFSLTHRQRYFNDDAEQFFDSLFEEAADAIHHTLFGPKPATIKECKAGFKLYRARRLSNPQESEKIFADPNSELGAPPKEVATQNRMNPNGIPLFYAAREITTCIAEVRPSIGDDIAVGTFKTTRDLKFFDFHGLDQPRTHSKLSYFHRDNEKRKCRRALLSYVHNAISQPVCPDGHGYVVTQAMAEYLCHKYKGRVDGIIFKSVQEENGVNYVLFNERASVAEMRTPNWQPSFPVKCVDKPLAYKVANVKYSSDLRAD